MTGHSPGSVHAVLGPTAIQGPVARHRRPGTRDPRVHLGSITGRLSDQPRRCRHDSDGGERGGQEGEARAQQPEGPGGQRGADHREVMAIGDFNMPRVVRQSPLQRGAQDEDRAGERTEDVQQAEEASVHEGLLDGLETLSS